MRDNIKGIEHFEKYISQRNTSNDRFTKLIDDNLNNPEANLAVAYRTIQSNYLHKLIAEYSSGVSIPKIAVTYKACIGYMEKAWSKESGYVQMLWMLSIGILLKIDDVEFSRLVALVNKEKEEDYLLDYIIAFREKSRKVNTTIRFDVPYKGIADATKMDKPQAQARIKQYLEKEWYKGHSDSYWYDNHKSKSDTYFGYWSFESAAITVIMGLDDSNYRDNQYYPKDLADYFRNANGSNGGDDNTPNKPNRWSVFDGIDDPHA